MGCHMHLIRCESVNDEHQLNLCITLKHQCIQSSTYFFTCFVWSALGKTHANIENRFLRCFRKFIRNIDLIPLEHNHYFSRCRSLLAKQPWSLWSGQKSISHHVDLLTIHQCPMFHEHFKLGSTWNHYSPILSRVKRMKILHYFDFHCHHVHMSVQSSVLWCDKSWLFAL